MLARLSIPASATPSSEAIQWFWVKYLDLLRRYGIAATAEPYIESLPGRSPPITLGERGFLEPHPPLETNEKGDVLVLSPAERTAWSRLSKL